MKAQEYINKIYIDYGDLNEKAEEQIKQAFIDGFKEKLLIQRVISSLTLEDITKIVNAFTDINIPIEAVKEEIELNYTQHN